MDPKEEVKKLLGEIEILKDELQEREKSLPAHSIRPHQLIAIEELEEKIRTLQERVKQLESPPGKEI
jgi:chromosome segregation ATPase